MTLLRLPGLGTLRTAGPQRSWTTDTLCLNGLPPVLLPRQATGQQRRSLTPQLIQAYIVSCSCTIDAPQPLPLRLQPTLSSCTGLPAKMTMRCRWFLFCLCLRASCAI